MKVKIRKATKKDVPRIVELLNSDSNLTDDEDLSYGKKLIEGYLKEPSDFVYVYEHNKKIIGVITGCFWRHEKHCQLFHLIVGKNYRNRGIGKALISYVERVLEKDNARLIYFYSGEKNKKMHKIAEKWKYKRGKKSYFFSKDIKK